MKKEFKIYYDEEGDYLEITLKKSKNAYFEDVGDDIFKRIDEKTGKIVGIGIHNFKKRAKDLKGIEIPFELYA